MDKLYYDRASNRLYAKELHTEKHGDILVATDERYVDVTDEIVALMCSKKLYLLFNWSNFLFQAILTKQLRNMLGKRKNHL